MLEKIINNINHFAQGFGENSSKFLQVTGTRTIFSVKFRNAPLTSSFTYLL